MTNNPLGSLDRLISRRIIGESTSRDAFNQPIPGVDRTDTVWGRRRDFIAARDQLGIQAGPGLTITRTRYHVRAETLNPWKPGDTFQDGGKRYRVQGVAKLDSGPYFELLVETTD